MHTKLTMGSGLVVLTLLAASVSAQSLTTTFAAGNSLNAPGSNHFDVTVLNPGGIVITAIDVNCENTRNGPVGSNFDVELYITDLGGTYAGNERTAALWHQVSTGSGVSMPTGTPTPIDVDDFFLPPGRFGMTVFYTFTAPAQGTAFSYTNGVMTFSNADLQIDTGSSTGNGLFTGSLFSPRSWNGTIHYEAGRTAAYGPYGVGCDGGSPLGAPTLVPGAANPVPRLGGQFDLELGNLGNLPTVGLMLVGLNFQQWQGFQLPLDLTAFGLPGCTGYVSVDFVVFFAHTGSPTHTFSLAFPNAPSLAGTVMGTQAVLLESTATNALPGNVTNLAAGRIGL